MPGEVRLIQLARILGLDATSLTRDAARVAIASHLADLADAFFREAADNDDVTGVESARDYLDARLADFDDLISPAAAASIRTAVRDRLRAWG